MVYYTDGSAHPNPGPGGFGVVIVDETTDEIIDTYAKSSQKTTNNAEEMKAIIFAVCDAAKRGVPAIIYLYYITESLICQAKF